MFHVCGSMVFFVIRTLNKFSWFGLWDFWIIKGNHGPFLYKKMLFDGKVLIWKKWKVESFKDLQKSYHFKLTFSTLFFTGKLITDIRYISHMGNFMLGSLNGIQARTPTNNFCTFAFAQTLRDRIDCTTWWIEKINCKVHFSKALRNSIVSWMRLRIHRKDSPIHSEG